MAEILRNRKRVDVVEYYLDYQSKDLPGAGFGFPCDEHGKIKLEGLQPSALENLRRCQDGTYNVTGPEVVRYAWSYWEPGVIRCDRCNAEVTLDSTFANGCPHCGLEYSGTGQLLAPRSQWGSEWAVQPEEDYGLYTPDYSDGDARQP